MGSSSRILAVVFDMDGTLFDSSSVVPPAFAATIEALGGPRLSDREVIESYALGPPAVIMEHFLGRAVTAAELDGYHRRLRDEAGRRGLAPYPGIVETLGWLAVRVPVGIFTNADTGNTAVLLGAAGIEDRFGAIVGADEVLPRSKPEPDGLLLACARLGVAVERTAYVGDAPQDGETAHRAGALAVGAGWGHLMTDAMAFDVIASDPAELAPALGLA